MQEEFIYKYEPLWGNWRVDKLIGIGSIGKVYRIYREEYNQRFMSALKVISIPTKDQMLLYTSTNDTNSTALMEKYFDNIVKNMLNEIKLLYELKGNSNIVSYEDHLIEKVEGKNEWYIFIRMEYVKSLKEYLDEKLIIEEDVIKIGKDICSALKICHNNGILHRDIKEANIFVGKNGEFKLGDFSVSKSISEQSYAQTKVGTMNYMSPEIMHGKGYDKSADIYSLGIVLYKLLNNKRLPFMPKYPNEFVQSDIESAYIKRMRGDNLPKPSNGSEEIHRIILKACSYKISDRYSSIEDMEYDLKNIEKNIDNLKFNRTLNRKQNNETIDVFSSRLNEEKELNKRNFKIPIIIGTIILVIALVVGSIIFLVYMEEVKSLSNNLGISKEEKVLNNLEKKLADINSKISPKETIPEKFTETPTAIPAETATEAPKDTAKSTEANISTSGINVVKNNGFEAGNKNYWVNAENTGTSEIVNSERYVGKYSLEINSAITVYQRLDMPKGFKYKIWFYVKTDSIGDIDIDEDAGAGFFIQYNEEKLKQKSIVFDEGTNNWSKYEMILDGKNMENNAATIYYWISKGKMYIDDIHIEEIE